MSDSPISQFSDLDGLMTTLDVNVVALAECFVGRGWRLSFPASKMAGLHYNLAGFGRIGIGADPPISFPPHTFVIIPPGASFYIDMAIEGDEHAVPRVVRGRSGLIEPSMVLERFVAGEEEPRVTAICGYFRAFYGVSIDLFTTLLSPLVEQFEATDLLGATLQALVTELDAQQVGMRAMTTTLLKQAIVILLRRSLYFSDVGLDRFSMLSDREITHAFADMVARPQASHSVMSLARSAGLSRSVFMMRFTRALGCSPMAALRQLRMRHATTLLASGDLSIEDVARAVGYASRSSFFRAFREVYGMEPSSYRISAF